MEIERLATVNNPENFLIGDRLHVDHYTATCQTVSQRGAIFMLDQYLDEPLKMNADRTNRGGYESSDLRRVLQSEKVLSIFSEIRDRLVPLETGDLLRIPFAGELFEGYDVPDYCEPDGHEQWPLMQDAHNRTASRCGKHAWGWLQNRDMHTSEKFCIVNSGGFVSGWNASITFGARLVFMVV